MPTKLKAMLTRIKKILLSSWFNVIFSTVFFLIGGYFLTYHLFFLELPVQDIAYKQSGGQVEYFRYDGVAYFEGTRLQDEERQQLRYVVPRVVQWVDGKAIEFLIKIDDVKPGVSPKEPYGVLQIKQSGGETTEVTLRSTALQRFKIPWETERDINRLKIGFQAESPDNQGVIFATQLRDVSLLPYAVFCFLLAGAALFWAVRRSGAGGYRLAFFTLIPVVVMYYFHSGAFISLEYISAGTGETAHGKVAPMAIHLGKLFETGYFKEKLYRATGFALVPLVSYFIEGTWATEKAFAYIYPTTRYLMFAWAALSLVYLGSTVYRYINPSVALIFGLLYATFFPFIVDFYDSEADSYFIPLMTLFLGYFIALIHRPDRFRRYAISLGLVMLVMTSVKITPVFLVFLVPLAIWLQAYSLEKKWLPDKRVIAILLILILGAYTGKQAGKLFQHPNRHVGIEGVPFQSNVLWHLIWAASGRYDYYSAHDFTKSGSLRKRRVAEATGIPFQRSGYLHHAQAATDKLYKPGVLNALKERPGFFYATAYVRFFRETLRFYKYFNTSVRLYWFVWLEDPRGERSVVRDHHDYPVIQFPPREVTGYSGERIPTGPRELELIRYGKMWKISPVVFLTKLIQGELTWMLDLILLGMALLGLSFIPRLDLKVFLFGCFLANFTGSTLLHGVLRYFNFTNVALLFGLALFVYTLYRSLSQSYKSSPVKVT